MRILLTLLLFCLTAQAGPGSRLGFRVPASGGGGSTFDWTGLSGQYWLEETGSSARVDSGPNGLNLTANNSPANQTGIVTNGLTCDGVNKCCTLADTATFNFTTNFSINFWVNPLVVGSFHHVLSKANYPTTISYDMNFPANSHVRMVIDDATLANYGESSINVTNSGWQMLTMIYDGTLTGNANRLKLFINSVSNSLTFAGTIPSSIASHADTFCIGALINSGSPGFAYPGGIDELSVFKNRTLSQSDINILYTNKTRYPN